MRTQHAVAMRQYLAAQRRNQPIERASIAG
jgi:hypothetical protein